MSTKTTQAKGSEMTTQNNLEENKRIVRAFIDKAFNKHQIDRVGDHLTPDMKWHGDTLRTDEGRGNTQVGSPRDTRVRQARPVGCGRRVPSRERKNCRGVGRGRPSGLRLWGWRLYPSLARA